MSMSGVFPPGKQFGKPPPDAGAKGNAHGLAGKANARRAGRFGLGGYSGVRDLSYSATWPSVGAGAEMR